MKYTQSKGGKGISFRNAWSRNSRVAISFVSVSAQPDRLKSLLGDQIQRKQNLK